MPLWFILLCAASVIAYAAIGGVLLAFSDFIMRSFDRIRDKGGIEAMQVINVEILRSVFMALSMGMVPVSAIIIVHAALHGDGAARILLMLAGGAYLIGAVAPTAIGNVPLNRRLDAMDAAVAGPFWKESYMTTWVTLNSLRTVACMLASGLTLAALVIR
tara:strand:- start:1223 stop:1702 length:480 start_codon:yes stop_codon:yes gene_type:complete